MEDRELLQQILQGQATLQESVKSLTATIMEIREESRTMRQQLSDYNMDLTLARAEINHLREDQDKQERANSEAHGLITSMIKEQVEIAWEDRRRCKAERGEDKKAFADDIMRQVNLQIERVKARTVISILVYALSVIAFFIKGWFFP